MHTEEKNTSRLPLLDWEVDDKIFVNQETGQTVNLGPLLHCFYDPLSQDIDLEIQEAIKYVGECMTTLLWHGHTDEVTRGGCSTVFWILYRLKDSLVVLHKPDPHREFKSLTERKQLEYLQGGFEILDKKRKRREKVEKTGLG